MLPGDEGQPTQSTDFSFDVTPTSQVIFPANPHRKLAIVVNTSDDADVYLSYSAQAQMGKGIALLRGGGTHEINYANLWQGVISAIATDDGTISGLEAV